MTGTTLQTPSQAYEEYYGPAIFTPLTETLLPQAGVQPGERVLDLACGTGIVTRRLPALVGPGGRVVGVDLNPAMLDVARAEPAPDGPPIEWRHGDGTALDLPDGAFDLVVVQQGYQFFPDRVAGARELRRVLADGGRAVLAVWKGPEHQPLYGALADIEEPHLRALGVALTRDDLLAPFSLGDPAQLRALLTDAGFAEVTITEATIAARFATPERFVERLQYAYAAVVPQFAEDPRVFTTYLAAISRDSRAVVDPYVQGDHVVVPMPTHIAVART